MAKTIKCLFLPYTLRLCFEAGPKALAIHKRSFTITPSADMITFNQEIFRRLRQANYQDRTGRLFRNV